MIFCGISLRSDSLVKFNIDICRRIKKMQTLSIVGTRFLEFLPVIRMLERLDNMEDSTYFVKRWLSFFYASEKGNAYS